MMGCGRRWCSRRCRASWGRLGERGNRHWRYGRASRPARKAWWGLGRCAGTARRAAAGGARAPDGMGPLRGDTGRRRVRRAVHSDPPDRDVHARARRLRLSRLDRRHDSGPLPLAVDGAGQRAGRAAWRPYAACSRPGDRDPAVGAVARRPVDQREGPRLPVPRGTVPGARDHPVGAAVLRGAGVPRAVRRGAAVARPVRWRGCGGPVLLLSGRDALGLARLHADVHRRLADRGRNRGAAVGGTGGGGTAAVADHRRAGGVLGAGGRGLHPLHRHRGARMRGCRGDRGMARAGGTAARHGARLVAGLGGSVRGGRGPLRRPGVRRPAAVGIPPRRDNVQPERGRCPTSGTCRRT